TSPWSGWPWSRGSSPAPTTSPRPWCRPSRNHQPSSAACGLELLHLTSPTRERGPSSLARPAGNRPLSGTMPSRKRPDREEKIMNTLKIGDPVRFKAGRGWAEGRVRYVDEESGMVCIATTAGKVLVRKPEFIDRIDDRPTHSE